MVINGTCKCEQNKNIVFFSEMWEFYEENMCSFISKNKLRY